MCCLGPCVPKSHGISSNDIDQVWWRHQIETFSALLAFCVGNSPVTGEFPAQRPVTRSFGVFFDLRLNHQLSKQWTCRWFETPSCSLWRHCNVFLQIYHTQHQKLIMDQGLTERIARSVSLVPYKTVGLCYHKHYAYCWCATGDLVLR